MANGSERAVDDIIEHTFQISVCILFYSVKFAISSHYLSIDLILSKLVKALSSFEYVEPSGKDMGINVRKKVETIIALLNDKDKIQEARNKAAANRDK